MMVVMMMMMVVSMCEKTYRLYNLCTVYYNIYN